MSRFLSQDAEGAVGSEIDLIRVARIPLRASQGSHHHEAAQPPAAAEKGGIVAASKPNPGHFVLDVEFVSVGVPQIEIEVEENDQMVKIVRMGLEKLLGSQRLRNSRLAREHLDDGTAQGTRGEIRRKIHGSDAALVRSRGDPDN